MTKHFSFPFADRLKENQLIRPDPNPHSSAAALALTHYPNSVPDGLPGLPNSKVHNPRQHALFDLPDGSHVELIVFSDASALVAWRENPDRNAIICGQPLHLETAFQWKGQEIGLELREDTPCHIIAYAADHDIEIEVFDAYASTLKSNALHADLYSALKEDLGRISKAMKDEIPKISTPSHLRGELESEYLQRPWSTWSTCYLTEDITLALEDILCDVVLAGILLAPEILEDWTPEFTLKGRILQADGSLSPIEISSGAHLPEIDKKLRPVCEIGEQILNGPNPPVDPAFTIDQVLRDCPGGKRKLSARTIAGRMPLEDGRPSQHECIEARIRLEKMLQAASAQEAA